MSTRTYITPLFLSNDDDNDDYNNAKEDKDFCGYRPSI